MMLKHIDSRLYQEFQSQAALQGIRLPPKGDAIPKIESSPVDDNIIRNAFQETKLKRMRSG